MKIRSNFNSKRCGVSVCIRLDPGDEIMVQSTCDECGRPRLVDLESDPFYDSPAWLIKSVMTPAEKERDRILSGESPHTTKSKS